VFSSSHTTRPPFTSRRMTLKYGDSSRTRTSQASFLARGSGSRTGFLGPWAPALPASRAATTAGAAGHFKRREDGIFSPPLEPGERSTPGGAETGGGRAHGFLSGVRQCFALPLLLLAFFSRPPPAGGAGKKTKRRNKSGRAKHCRTPHQTG